MAQASSLQELVQLKENEWKEAQELRNNSLQAALQQKDKQLNNEKLRFRKLKEDFEYNLKLLEERDQELARYDAHFSQLRNANSFRDGEISDLKIRLDELNLKLSHEEKAREELQRHYQQRLREHQQELNQFRLQKESEVQKEREEFESFKRQLQTQLRAAEEEVEAQKQELMAGFDDTLRKREHEFRKKTDEMTNSLLASELKVKLLTKELELVRASSDRTKDELETTESVIHNLEKQLKQKEWEASDEQNMNRAKVAELEAQIEQLKTAASKSEARFQHKHTELDRYTKEKERELIAAKQLHIEQERSLEEKIRLLQNQLETEQVECRRLQWAHKDAAKEKDLELQKYEFQGIVIELQNKLDKQVSDQAWSTVAQDLELEALRQQEGKMRMEISQHKENIERYKKELTLAMERESSQERSKAQMEVDWQRRCEDTEREAYKKQEQLTTALTKARDEARALAQERERELIQQDNLIQVLTRTKDQAVMTLQRHGLSVPTEIPCKENRVTLSSEHRSVDDIQDLPPQGKNNILQQQNANLREVIRQMRQDMEDLSNELASRPASVMVQQRDDQEETSVPLTAEYVESLEREIKDLKSTNRSLTQQIEELSQSSKPPLLVSRPPKSTQSQDTFTQAHIKQLNGSIGALRQEKLELSAHVKKHQATVDHLQGLLNQAHEEVRQKQVAVDQLQYELTALGRRSADQHSLLQQRVTELELQLTQTRREADEYFKSGLERNAEATSLGNQLSTLKMELASQGREAPSFNPQATIVTQLQDEIRHLRKQLTSTAGVKPVDKHSVDSVFSARPEALDVARLRMKLQAAVRRISGLAQEKEQLIQMGNRLRAELARYTGGRRIAPPGPTLLESTEPHLIQAPSRKPATGKTPGEIKDHFQGQLNAVEKLQYQLTSQELQFAQRMAQQKAADQVKVTVLSSSSESNGGEKASELPSELRDHVTRDTDSKNSDQKHEHVTRQSTNRWTPSPPDGQPFFTSLSEGQASLQEIWKMLDEEDSFRSPTPRRLHPSSPREPKTSDVLVPDHIPARDAPERDVFTLKGKRTGIEKKSTTQQRAILSKKAAGKAKSTPKKLRVRNYNIKDDT